MKKFIASLSAALVLLSAIALTGCKSAIAPFGGNSVATKSADKYSGEKLIGGEPVSFADTDITLIKGKKSVYKVIIGSDSTVTEKYASEELVYFLERSTGCKLEIATDENPDENGSYISVGDTKLLKAAGIVPDYAELGDNGVSIYTIGKNVYIAGAAEYATLFSVYRFLYYQIGYRAYAYDHIEYDYFDELKLKNFDYKYRPALGTVTAEDAEMSGKDKTKEALRMYIYASKNGGYDFSGNLYNNLWCHTTEFLASPAKYPHLWKNGQLCYSKAESVEVVTQTLIGKYVNSATGPYLMIGGSDNVGSCDCDECKAGEQLYGGASGVYARFLNLVAENLEKYMTENGMTKRITLVGLFYYSYVKPPVNLVNGEYVPVNKESVPRSGQVSVGVMYTPIQSCYTHPFGDDTCDINSVYTDYIKGWAAITDHLMMYSYGTNFQAFKFHFNNWAYMGDTYRFFADLGMTYYFEQACAANGISPMSSMRVYVRSRLAWNPYYDTQDLIDEFIEHYYGAGSEGVKEYFETVMENFERVYTMTETECEGIYYTISKSEYWTRPVLKNLESYLEKAMFELEENGKSDKETYIERIFREYVLLKDNELLYYGKYLDEEELAELEKLVEYGREKYNITRSTEHG